MFILALIVAAVVIGVVLVPVLVLIGLVALAYYAPKVAKQVKESDANIKKASDYFSDDTKNQG